MNKSPFTNAHQREEVDVSLRPQLLNDFIGQEALKNNLSVYIQAAKARGEHLDHVLFYGPPGLGKTTLSQIVAHELQSPFKMTSGPILSKSGSLAAILSNLQEKEVLFIDEIHRLIPAVEEVLYSAMEDFALDLVIGEGPGARAVRIDLPKFTLIGATTRLGLLTNPLRDRFGIPLKLDFYTHQELMQVIMRATKIYNLTITNDAAYKLASCSRGTPRIALRFLKRVRDFAQLSNSSTIDAEAIMQTLRNLEVDSLGLDKFDHKYMRYIYEHYKGGPVGIDTIAAALSEDKDTIEDTIEPHLMQIGFVSRTPRGRMLTDTCLKYLNISSQDKLGLE